MSTITLIVFTEMPKEGYIPLVVQTIQRTKHRKEDRFSIRSDLFKVPSRLASSRASGSGRKEGNGLFDDTLNTFYFTVIWRRTYGKGVITPNQIPLTTIVTYLQKSYRSRISNHWATIPACSVVPPIYKTSKKTYCHVSF